jgi:DNA-binding transcriptional MocR family regulator
VTTALIGANLNERVYDELRTRLLTRQEPAGAKLSLHVLATELGVSRSPVHHALTRLVAEGLLTVRPRRGYYVAPVTVAAVAEGYDVRLALELYAAKQLRAQGVPINGMGVQTHLDTQYGFPDQMTANLASTSATLITSFSVPGEEGNERECRCVHHPRVTAGDQLGS